MTDIPHPVIARSEATKQSRATARSVQVFWIASPQARLAMTGIAIALSAALLWPAAWNGYPLVFSDTGTYLTQAIEHHLGWDRPPFYSLAILPLHLTLSTWPVVIAQALLTAYMLHLLRRVLLPTASAWWLVPICGDLTVASAAPWFVSQLMPDLFTPLLAIALGLLALTPDRLSGRERLWLVLLSAFMIAAHQSNLPLALALPATLVALRRRFGVTTRRVGFARLAAPPTLACVALLTVNLIGHGRLSLSPYGNVFLLARAIEDGPGRDALRRDCPQSGWLLCPFRDAMPDNADDFLWRADSPLARAGGAIAVSAEAGTIIAAAWRAAPSEMAQAALRNFARQLAWFATGDGLEAWPNTVTPAIALDFPPAEYAAFAKSLQSTGSLRVPWPLPALHMAAAWLGVALCGAVLVLGWRRDVAAGFAAAALLTVLVNAAVTGCLSGPHDRYQSRVMWLPLAIALPALPAVLTRRRAPAPQVAVAA
jgi:hypothetical protein